MTEFRKLTSSIEELHAELIFLSSVDESSLFSGEASSFPLLETMFYKMKKVTIMIVELLPRVLKILLKAREKDPNRQIYNENMCKKIELLYTNYCEVIFTFYRGKKNNSTAISLSHSTPEDDEAYYRFLTMIKENYKELVSKRALFPASSVSCCEEARHAEISKTHTSTNNSIVSNDDVKQSLEQCNMDRNINTSSSIDVGSLEKNRAEVEWLQELLLANDEDAVKEKYLGGLESEIPFFLRLATAYHKCIQERAAAESWQKRVAVNLKDAYSLEESIRSLIQADEHQEYRRLLEAKREEQLEIYFLLDQKRENQWRDELMRRQDESTHLLKASSVWRATQRTWSELLASEYSAFEEFESKEGDSRSGCGIADADTYSSASLCTSEKKLIRHVGRKNVFYTVATHLLDLVQQIYKTPDNPNIRVIRNNHPAFMQHFGHPCYYLRCAVKNEVELTTSFHTDPNPSAKELLVSVSETEKSQEHQDVRNTQKMWVKTSTHECLCAHVLRFAEYILYCIGYRLHYDSWEEVQKKRGPTLSTSSNNVSLFPHRANLTQDQLPDNTASRATCKQGLKSTFINFADRNLEGKNTIGAEIGVEMVDFYFPCGEKASLHRYTDQGFALYGERMYCLVEPDPMENSDSWMEWYQSLKELMVALQVLVTKDLSSGSG